MGSWCLVFSFPNGSIRLQRLSQHFRPEPFFRPAQKNSQVVPADSQLAADFIFILLVQEHFLQESSVQWIHLGNHLPDLGLDFLGQNPGTVGAGKVSRLPSSATPSGSGPLR
jgi:hypothetical protein